MSLPKSCLIALFLSLAACRTEDIPPERLLQSDLCLEREKWVTAIDYTREFGKRHDLRMEGGAQTFDGEGLNVALLKGNSLFSGPDFALYVTSDPFRGGAANFSAVSKETMTDGERDLARRYVKGVAQFGCKRTHN